MRDSQAALSQLIAEHLTRYPAMEPRDAYKLLYQGVLGPGHLIDSPGDFANRLRAEYEAALPEDAEPLWQAIRPDEALGRLHLRPFKARGGGLDLLVASCLETAKRGWGKPWELMDAWATFVSLCRQGECQVFPLPEVLHFSRWLEEQGYPAVHHSTRYRETYKPAYRLVAREFLSDSGTLTLPPEEDRNPGLAREGKTAHLV